MGEVMKENVGFTCENCGTDVPKHNNGSYRNHCTKCLYSKHLDNKPGDRLSECQGLMAPIGQRLHSKKGIQILHKCLLCGHEQFNIIDEVEDDFFFFFSLKVK